MPGLTQNQRKNGAKICLEILITVILINNYIYKDKYIVYQLILKNTSSHQNVGFCFVFVFFIVNSLNLKLPKHYKHFSKRTNR